MDTQEKITEHVKQYKDLTVYSHEVIEKLDSTSADKKSLLENYICFTKFIEKTGIYVWVPFVIETTIDKKLRESLEELFPGNHEKFHHAISSPTQLNKYQNMRVKICDTAMQETLLESNIKELSSRI